MVPYSSDAQAPRTEGGTNLPTPTGIQPAVTSLALPFPAVLTRAADATLRAPAGVEAIVAAARNGDDLAFERLYRQHVGRIYALALRLSRNPSDADALTQDIFVRVWERLASFRGESAFGTWLHRLAINVILSDRRSAWRRGLRVTEMDDVIELEAAAPAPPAGMRLDLDDAIATLPPGARTVFVLHDVEGYEHAEIAELSGIAVGTSKAQLFRARRLLREALDR